MYIENAVARFSSLSIMKNNATYNVVWLLTVLLEPAGGWLEDNHYYNKCHLPFGIWFLLAHDAFIRTNRRVIAMMFICLSVWDGRALSSYGAL